MCPGGACSRTGFVRVFCVKQTFSPSRGRWGCGLRHRNFGLPRPEGRSSPQLLRRGPQPHLPLEGKKVCLTQKTQTIPLFEQAPPGHLHTCKADSYARGQERSGLKGLGCARGSAPEHFSDVYRPRNCSPPPGQGRRLLGRRLSRPSRSALTPSKPRPYVARGRAVYPGQVALAGVAAARR